MNKESNYKFIAVIPALNEESTIKDVINNLKNYVDEIIVVNDGSNDKTEKFAKQSGALVINNYKQYGPEKATDIGFKKAIELKADYVITFDADNQHPHSIIPGFKKIILKEKIDIIVGKREKFPRWSEYIFSIYSKFRTNISDPINGFKIINSAVYKEIGFFDNIRGVTAQIIFRAHKKKFLIKEFFIKINKRKDNPRIGKSLIANTKIISGLIRIIIDDIKSSL